jgi:hypothetical protein
MNQNKRTEERLPLQKECLLVNRSGSIEAQTVNMSKKGITVKIDRILPFKIGSELTVSFPSMGNHLAKAKLIWTKKDSNNMIRLGLKFQLPFPDFKHKYSAL